MTTEERSVRERLVAAAFELFEEQGYESTTVDEIAVRAAVSRSTFFRNFGSKEDVIFPEHAALLARIEQRLATSQHDSRAIAVADAARLVLAHYLSEGELARARYRLTSTVVTLRSRELASLRQYELLFASHLRRWWAEEPDGSLRAELMAAAVVSAHNYVLRGWLRDESTDPMADFNHAMDVVLAQSTSSEETAAVVVVKLGGDAMSIARKVQRALEAHTEG
jgi:AcrR family transcriptional regulator